MLFDTLSDYSLNALLEGLDRLMLVDIPLDRGDNAQQIFESINAHGSPLRQPDLIRNYVIMQCPEGEKKDFYNQYWLPFENRFDSDQEFEDFFRYFVEIQIGDFVNKKSVYVEFRKWFMAKANDATASDIMKELIRYADYYRDLYYKDLSAFSKNNLWKLVIDLRNIKSKMPMPFMIEIMRLYEDKQIDDTQLKEIITTINSFIVRRAIIGLDTSGITKFFCRLLKKVRLLTASDVSRIVDAVNYCVLNEANESGSRFPTDNEIINALDNQNTYQYRDALHFFFDRYENENMQVNSYQQTLGLQIEHIMPQDGSKWLAETGLTQEEYDVQKMRLGNLTLVTKHDNPKMSNNLFDYKSAVLKGTGHFRLNTYVSGQPKWGKNEIDHRNWMLTQEFLRLYPMAVCNLSDDFDAIISEQKKSVNSTRSRDIYAAKLWSSVDVFVEKRGVFEKNTTASLKAYRNFNFNKPYHLYIDLWNYKDKKVNLGIWFSNAADSNFSAFTDRLEDLNSDAFSYVTKSGDGLKRGNIMTSLDMVPADDAEFNAFVGTIMEEIYRLYDFTADNCLEETTSSSSSDRLPAFRFSFVQIPIGDSIEFSCHGNENDGAICKVVSDKRVEYCGKVWSLSALAAYLSHRTTQVAGPQYFKYKGEWLNDIRRRLGT